MFPASSLIVGWMLGSHSQISHKSTTVLLAPPLRACHRSSTESSPEQRDNEGHTILEDSWNPSINEGETEKPFTAVQSYMDHVLSALPGQAVAVDFKALDGTDLDDIRLVPETFHRFYRGQLEDFVDSSSGKKKNLKRRTQSFRLDLAYRGTDFCGWQTQQDPNQQQQQQSNQLPAVQDVVQAALNGRNVRVAGRTDAGVHAVGQVARVRCDATLTASELEQELREARTGSSWACRRVMAVSHGFHPTFGATSRSYVYLLDANTRLKEKCGNIQDLTSRLNALLAPLQGETLPFIAFSYGRLKTKTSDCTLHHAQARYLQMNDHYPVVAIELTGDRFLRRMVRILVATALRLAANTESNDTTFDSQSLLNLVQTQDRRQAALPAPAEGLVFVSACFDPPSDSI